MSLILIIQPHCSVFIDPPSKNCCFCKFDGYTEFKSSFSDKVVESLVAFANANGGKVLIGVDDKGDPVRGFSIGPESLQNLVKALHLYVVSLRYIWNTY